MSDSIDSDGVGAESVSGRDEVHRALAHGYRRFALRCLQTEAGDVTVDELARRLETHDETGDVATIRLRLYHVHLPKLDDFGFVAFDPDEMEVGLEPAGRRVLDGEAYSSEMSA